MVSSMRYDAAALVIYEQSQADKTASRQRLEGRRVMLLIRAHGRVTSKGLECIGELNVRNGAGH
jgi:hypothetical protein